MDLMALFDSLAVNDEVPIDDFIDGFMHIANRTIADRHLLLNCQGMLRRIAEQICSLAPIETATPLGDQEPWPFF